MNRLSGFWLIVIAAAMWSSGGVLIKTLTGGYGMDPLAVACLRSAFAGLVLCWALPGIRGAALRRASAAILAYTAMVLSFVTSTTFTSAANAIFLEYFNPLLVAAFAYSMGTEKPRLKIVVSLMLGTLGVAIIVVSSWAPGDRAGVALGLGCAAASAIFALVQKNLHGGSPTGLTSLYNLIAAAVFLPFAWQHFHGIPLAAVALVAFTGAFQLGIPFALYVKGLRTVPVVEAQLITLLEPVLNPIWVWVFRGERPGHWTLVGGAAIMGALVIHVVTHRGGTAVDPVAAPALEAE